MALYPGAMAGADVVHRVHAQGTEDYVVFEERPAAEAIAYDVDVTHVAGLRLVSNVLEFLDEGGAPRLRISPPYVVDATGARQEARIAVSGCAYDTDASGPWGRPVTRAGAARCGVIVTWTDVTYPAVVDPSWNATGSMNKARIFHTATLLNSGKVLIAGGFLIVGAGWLADAELFDSGTSSFAATGAMGTGRYGHTATLLDSGQVLIAGGQISAYGFTSTAELFDGTSAFSSTGAMTTARGQHSATRLNSGNVLIAGGYYLQGPAADSSWTSVPLSSAELFDGTSTFTATGSMAAERYTYTATLLNSGQVLIAGGGSDRTSCELFDGTSTFTSTGPMTVARGGHTATLLNSGKVLITGGLSGSSSGSSSAELFDGISTFAATGAMTMARQGHTATLLGSGKVLVAGGYGSSTDVQPSAELFDGTSSFAAISPMGIARASHTATLLGSTKVLVTGGNLGDAPT